MRLFLFPLISYFVVRVWASGYQGCLERVLLYNAYQIDEYNGPNDRKIGFKCRQWDAATGTCRNNQWDECRSRTGGRCNFDELCFFLGRAPRNNGWQALIPGTDRLDVRLSAQNCMNLHYPNNPASPIRRIYNFPPHSAMKGGGTKWNEFVVDLSAHINDTYRRMPKPLTDEENAKFSNFDYAADRVREARTRDHGPHLVRNAQARLTVPVVTRNMGANQQQLSQDRHRREQYGKP
ncbi:hypothetical protein BU23DRAFT_533797 [Bimuria novae-zelandiae CBS 107.79]|uniref:Uncharacterized protein n=1 Tax=Bimuria novae-zelandiae CBS 107.79 TaxID=1447943 RepID=A0A6A5V8Q4_9PLEO|nr:hypothetical protein BU23DRAFT_533797 [Bimuria novae-zelandiae CBS 107.79]